MSTSLLSSYMRSKVQRCGHLWYSGLRDFSKKYSYNLDDLIEWKKSTNLAFGNPRKCTKTGKLRKSKNDDNEQLKKTLESLSAQSTYYSNMEFEVSESPDIQNKATYQESDTDNSQANDGQPFFPSDFKSMQRPSARENFQTTTVSETNVQIPKKSVRKKTILKKANFNQVDKNSSSNTDLNDGISNDDDTIVIPVISPVPSGNAPVPKTYDEKLNPSIGKQFKSKELPIEPPLSFSLINQIPLVSKDHCSNDELSTRILQFKEDIASLSLKTIPSVKTILSRTMPDLNRFFLNRWRENMINELGEDGFKAHQDANIKRGVNFHANVMELLAGKSPTDIQVMPDNQGHWTSLQTAMKHVSGIQALEEDLRHSVLMYRGVLDCIAKYKDVLCVIDWKTSKKPRPLLKNTYDDPLQVAAYIGLVNDCKENVQKFGEVNHGLLVILYPDGSPAHIHMMNKTLCEQYWHDWRERLNYFYQLTYTTKFGST